MCLRKSNNLASLDDTAGKVLENKQWADNEVLKNTEIFRFSPEAVGKRWKSFKGVQDMIKFTSSKDHYGITVEDWGAQGGMLGGRQSKCTGVTEEAIKIFYIKCDVV